MNVEKLDTYHYTVGVEEHDKPDINIDIYFLNSKFEHCDFSFLSSYTEVEWQILAEINSEIKRIKKTYEKKEEKK